ncbi:MAG: DNA sulfur modification protein DndE [Tissierellaceae bacterium]|nr:DNA sulfur modification protein DndE [Tissierellaceae bacterium]
MILKQFKLSQPEKEKLIRIKSRTNIQNWNVICRWALCWSLSEPTIPGGIEPLSDSNVEMTWLTFAGEYHEVYEAIIRQRCINDGLGDSQEVLAKYFRLHLNRGINHFSTRDVLKSCQDLLTCINLSE